MAKLKKAEIQPLVDRLLQLYPNAECALHFGSVYQLIVAVALSAQTTDKSVNEVTPALFRRCPDARAMAQISEEELQGLIQRIGMYKTKSRNIIKMAQMLVEKYDGQVPEDYDKLVELPGVGRKTANVVLSVGFGHQRIAVDTHVFRLANRMGFVKENDVLKTELGLMKAVPEQNWSDLHHALIWHGRQVCTARNPKCEECGVKDLCKKNLEPAKKAGAVEKTASTKKVSSAKEAKTKKTGSAKETKMKKVGAVKKVELGKDSSAK